MALQEYRRKRSFDRTPEPRASAGPRARKDALSFVVQLHHARRRHYDFRLELDGVLRSWAVPKGPSFRPEDKRLAVEVEDHPLSYAGFEGIIPHGNYGAGHVAVFDRGTWTPEGDPREALARGKLDFELAGDKLHGRWSLVRTRKDGAKPQWLLFKRNDAWAADLEADDLVDEAAPAPATAAKRVRKTATKAAPAAKARGTATKPAQRQAPKAGTTSRARAAAPPAWRPPMLTTAAKAPPEGDDWVHEWKWDGYRMTAAVAGAHAAMWSRNGLSWNDKVPHVLQALAALGRDLEVDGELIAVDARGHSDFNAMQAALKAGRAGELRYVVFDLMALDGEDLVGLPLLERKERLRALLGKKPGVLVYSEHIEGHGDDVFAAAGKHGLEGIISKRRASTYQPGTRTRDWLKIKAVDTREFAIVGYTEPKGSRSGIGALLVARLEGGRLVFAGRVGTGYTDEVLRTLHKRLQPLRRDSATVQLPPHTKLRDAHVRWVDPVLVAEVIFRGWGKEGLLRQPSFHRLRDDRVADASLVQPGALPKLSSPTRVVYPDAKITKQEVFEYYAAATPRLLEDMGGRLLSIVRCPSGIGGQHFFQKHLGPGFGDAIHEKTIAENDGKRAKYFHVDDLAGVLALAQMNALEFHPWGSRVEALEHPDRLVFDLDPDPGVPWTKVKAAARELHDRLESIGLQSFARLTGGKGVHVVVPIAPLYPWPTARAFCEAFAATLAEQAPDRFVATMSKAKRKDRIFIDWLRNGRGATAIASWSLRARPGAPVAMPVTWEELARARVPDRFNLRNALERVGQAIWDDAAARTQELPLQSSGGRRH